MKTEQELLKQVFDLCVKKWKDARERKSNIADCYYFELIGMKSSVHLIYGIDDEIFVYMNEEIEAVLK